jgi:predicted RNase H-like nuclease (RuvC/YqgF family)
LKSNSFFKVEGVQEDRKKNKEFRKTERINFFLKKKLERKKERRKEIKGKLHKNGRCCIVCG